MVAPADTDRILTIPNVISFLRIALIPVFVALIVDRDTTRAGLVLFVIVVATDWVDGALARATGQVSDLVQAVGSAERSGAPGQARRRSPTYRTVAT